MGCKWNLKVQGKLECMKEIGFCLMLTLFFEWTQSITIRKCWEAWQSVVGTAGALLLRVKSVKMLTMFCSKKVVKQNVNANPYSYRRNSNETVKYIARILVRIKKKGS